MRLVNRPLFQYLLGNHGFFVFLTFHSNVTLHLEIVVIFTALPRSSAPSGWLRCKVTSPVPARGCPLLQARQSAGKGTRAPPIATRANPVRSFSNALARPALHAPLRERTFNRCRRAQSGSACSGRNSSTASTDRNSQPHAACRADQFAN